MAPTPQAHPRATSVVGRAVRRGGKAAYGMLVPFLGGRTRTRVIVVLACVLALSSADTATVGAAATELRHSLHITNFDIGLLVAVTAVVGAIFSLPFGALADRVRRTWLLGAAVALWGVAMVWSATAGSFGNLLLSRLALGGVTAVAGPAVASLVGDWFPGGERGQIYSYILTGELLGAGAGFAFTGDIAALSWRAAFIILAIPAFAISWAVFHLPEPRRHGQGALAPDAGTRPWKAAQQAAAEPATEQDREQHTDAQRLALERGIRPDPRLVRQADPKMGFMQAVRYVLGVRTNVVLIISGACGYYFLAGVQTFGVEFVRGQYHVAQVLANLLLIVVGAGAVVGVLVSGPLGDSLLRRGFLSGRVTVAAVAASFTVVILIPALVTHSALSALPYVVLAGLGLSAQNPPIDAARLDIMPAWLWGRAEGVRTFVRTGAQALAPLLFGAVSDYVFGGGASGLRWTFVVMLLPLSASAVYLFVAARRYPTDVATAAAAAAAPVGGAPSGTSPPARRARYGAQDFPGNPSRTSRAALSRVIPIRRRPAPPDARRVGGWGPGPGTSRRAP